MKAEKFLNRLGLSVNIVIVILLLVIVYYLYCINDNLSMETFSVGATGAFARAVGQANGPCTNLSGGDRAACLQRERDQRNGVTEEEETRRQTAAAAASAAAAEAAARQENRNRSQEERRTASEAAKIAEATSATIGSRVAGNLKKSRNNGTAYMARTSTGQNRSQNVQNNKARRQEIGRAQAADAAAAAAGGGLRTNNPGMGTSNAAIRGGLRTNNPAQTPGGGQ